MRIGRRSSSRRTDRLICRRVELNLSTCSSQRSSSRRNRELRTCLRKYVRSIPRMGVRSGTPRSGLCKGLHGVRRSALEEGCGRIVLRILLRCLLRSLLCVRLRIGLRSGTLGGLRCGILGGQLECMQIGQRSSSLRSSSRRSSSRRSNGLRIDRLNGKRGDLNPSVCSGRRK